MTDLTPLTTALNKPVRAFTWHDRTARVVFQDGTIAAGCGETKREAWGRLCDLVKGRG